MSATCCLELKLINALVQTDEAKNIPCLEGPEESNQISDLLGFQLEAPRMPFFLKDIFERMRRGRRAAARHAGSRHGAKEG